MWTSAAGQGNVRPPRTYPTQELHRKMQDKYKETTNRDLKTKQTDWKRESELEEATGKGLEEFLILFCLEIFPLSTAPRWPQLQNCAIRIPIFAARGLEKGSL